MKKNLLLIIAILSVLAVNAQKPDRNYVKINYLHFADEPLPKWAETYAVKVESSSKNVMVGGPEERALALLGFNEAASFNEADVQITFEIQGVRIVSDIKSKSRSVKKGEETVTVYDYYYILIASPTGEYFIRLKDGTQVKNIGFSGDKYAYEKKSKMFSDRGSATKAYNSMKESLMEETARNSIKNLTASLGKSTNNAYGYYMNTETETIVTGKSKKLDYSDLDVLLASFKEAVELYNQDKFDEYVDVATECVKGWEKALLEFNPDDKKAAKKGRINEKIADLLCYNIAVAYLYMDEFSKATEYTEKGLLIDKGMTGRSLLTGIAKKKRRFEKNEERENS